MRVRVMVRVRVRVSGGRAHLAQRHAAALRVAVRDGGLAVGAVPHVELDAPAAGAQHAPG